MQTKHILLTSIIAAIITVPALAVDDPVTGDKRVTSVGYVTAQVNTRQPKIPAAGTNTSTPGTSVVMYTTNGEGEIGERQIYTGASNYTSGDANKLVTASALDGAVNNIPTMQTSKLTCANPTDCTLWTIDDQTVYGDDND